MAIIVKRDEQDPESVELIAKSIIRIAEGFQEIEKSQLNRRALVVLLKDLTGLSNRDINLVLNSLAELKSNFIKEPKKEARTGRAA